MSTDPAANLPGLRLRLAEGSRSRRDKKSKDEVVQNTDNDAATSRISAIDAGYLDDPFAKLLTPELVQRRLPLMNRGTYVRTIGLDKIVDTFIASCPGRKQIISLGAGRDTRYFRLKRRYPDLDLIYHEIDFQANNAKKISQIKTDDFFKTLHEFTSVKSSDFQIGEHSLISSGYNIHSIDLRNLPSTIPGIVNDLPTLLISECCLIYLSPKEADEVLTFFTQLFRISPLAIVIYEPIRPNDAFGRTMVRNLTARGIQLQTLEQYPELEDQRNRLWKYEFVPRAEDIDYVWHSWVSEEEKERVERLEWMDEVEEFILFAQHYAISWGWKGWIDDSKWSSIVTSK